MIIVPSLHPAYLLRSGDEKSGQARFEKTVIDDFKKAWRLTKQTPDWEEGTIWERAEDGRLKNLFPTLQEVFDFFGALYASGPSPVVTVDIETSRDSPVACELLCVGLGFTDHTGRDRALCLPFLSKGRRPYWTNEARAYAWSWLQSVLADPRVRKNLQNGAFDTTVLTTQGAQVNGWWHDTMLAHHIIDSELPHGLGYLGTRYLDVAYWKDDAKGDEKNYEADDETLRAYNLRDILTTHRLQPKLEKQVNDLGLWPLYQEEVKLNKVMARATIRGIAVDDQRKSELTTSLTLKRRDALERLQAISGGNIEPRKPAHLKYLLFEMLKFPVVMKTANGSPSTNKDAMVLLALAADTQPQKDALAAIIDFRGADKALGTWAEGLPILGDGRFHPTWKTLTTSGRFNSSPNAQNLPKSIQRIFKAAAPGLPASHPASAEWCFVGVDLSQAELRYIAYTANDPFLLTMYDQGIDVHTVNIALLFGVRCPPEFAENTNAQTEAFIDEIVPQLLGSSVDPKKFPICPAKKWKTTRTLGKNFEFGTNYGAIAETVCDVLRAKRDDAGKLLFPDLDLALIEALLATKLRIRPALTKWWTDICIATQKKGYFQCPVSGRIRWFRDGFKKNEMLNVPIQTGVASVMNQRLVRIQDAFDQETRGACQVVLQVHDALTFECPRVYAPRAQQVIYEILNEPFALPGYPQARLPCEMPKIGDYVDQV